MSWTPLPLPDLTDASPAVRPYLEDLADVCAQLTGMLGNKGKNVGRPTAAEAAGQLNAAAQVARRVDQEGATILTDYARQLRRVTITAVGYDMFVDALTALAGIIRAAPLTPQLEATLYGRRADPRRLPGAVPADPQHDPGC